MLLFAGYGAGFNKTRHQGQIPLICPSPFQFAANPSFSPTSLPGAASVFSGAPPLTLAAGVPSCCRAARMAALRWVPSLLKASAGSGCLASSCSRKPL